MKKNVLMIGAVVIMAIVAVFAFADPEPNAGTDNANPSESGREHANDNAAFNRGDDVELLPPGSPCTDNSQCISGACSPAFFVCE